MISNTMNKTESSALPDWLEKDSQYVWHPYSAMQSGAPVYGVESAHGVRIQLADSQELIDGMASWWYNHPDLNAAIEAQLKNMSHVMFGGLTHRPAVELAEQLVALTPDSLQTVFFSDSGSVAVEVAMKMAIQYWLVQGQPNKHRFVTLRGGYHGDTLATMSVCDPDNGLHSFFAEVLPKQIFLPRPKGRFGDSANQEDLDVLEGTLERHHNEIAALILEPIVQGAGGMYFYSADYLAQLHECCMRYNVLLIADEIATGFGRSGKLFACEHAQISPDIMCVGKALTGGYMTLAATLTTDVVSEVLSSADPGVFMHGPTFMANPMACAVALASIRLLLNSPWQNNIARIEKQLKAGLAICNDLPQVADVRVLSAIGVIEMVNPVDMKTMIPEFVKRGVWVRPFGKLVYLMPPYVISETDLDTLIEAAVDVVRLS